MKITGELLKSERTRKGLNVQDVAFALKLSQKIILAIEAGETENLPAKTFIRGFVKSYAQFLKIDVDQVMRQFQEEMGSTHPFPKNAIPQQTAIDVHSKSAVREQPETPLNKKASKNSSPSSSEQTNVLNPAKGGRSLIYIGVAVVLVILIVAINKISERYQKERILNPQDISKVQPLNPNESQVNSSATTTPEAVAVVDAPISSANENSATSSNVMSTTNSSSQSDATATPAAAAAKNEVEVDDGFEPSNGKPIEIIIEAKKDTEILYARGNTKSFSKLKLTAKQVQVIRSTTGLHLKADDGGAIHMVVNGIDKGAAGPNNKPVRLSF